MPPPCPKSPTFEACSGDRGRLHRLRRRFGSASSIARFSVRALSQEVGVSIVAGVLLDQLHVEPAQAEGRAARGRERLIEVMSGRCCLAGGDLCPEPLEVPFRVHLVDSLNALIAVSRVSEDIPDALTREAPPEPRPLYLRHVTDQAQQREVRRFHGGSRQLGWLQ